MDYRLRKKLLSTKTDFWIRAARTSTLLQVRNEAIRENMEFWKNWKTLLNGVTT